MNHTRFCLPSQSWSSFTDPGGMEGWVGLGITTASKEDRSMMAIAVVSCCRASLGNWSTWGASNPRPLWLQVFVLTVYFRWYIERVFVHVGRGSNWTAIGASGDLGGRCRRSGGFLVGTRVDMEPWLGQRAQLMDTRTDGRLQRRVILVLRTRIILTELGLIYKSLFTENTVA